MSITDREIFACKGEKVTCENGHLIATARHDLYRYDEVRIEDFDWHTPEQPKPYAPMENCPICDARWYRGDPGWAGLNMHFEDGWR